MRHLISVYRRKELRYVIEQQDTDYILMPWAINILALLSSQWSKGSRYLSTPKETPIDLGCRLLL